VDGVRISPEESRLMEAGWHGIEVKGTLRLAADQIALEWRPPSADNFQSVPRSLLRTHPCEHGLVGRYFRGERTSVGASPIAATPEYTDLEPALSFDAPEPSAAAYLFPTRRTRPADDEPPPLLGAKGATLEWVGTVDLPEGTSHAIRLQATTPAQVFVDGTLRVSTPGTSDGRPVETEFEGKSGKVPILVRSLRPANDPLTAWRLRVLWREPGGAWTAFVPYHPARIDENGGVTEKP